MLGFVLFIPATSRRSLYCFTEKKAEANNDNHSFYLNLQFFPLLEIAMTKNIFDIDSDYSKSPVTVLTNGNRRLGVDRRQFSYSLYFPEKRSGKDRRIGKCRRKFPRINAKY